MLKPQNDNGERPAPAFRPAPGCLFYTFVQRDRLYAVVKHVIDADGMISQWFIGGFKHPRAMSTNSRTVREAPASYQAAQRRQGFKVVT